MHKAPDVRRSAHTTRVLRNGVEKKRLAVWIPSDLYDEIHRIASEGSNKSYVVSKMLREWFGRQKRGKRR